MKCSTKFCKNERASHRTICWKCLSRRQKKINPATYFFNALRNNARRRNKEFNLTLEQFRKFCSQTAYLEKKGKNGFNLSIDRIKSNMGYSIDNIQVLTLSQNSSKKDNDYPF